MQAFQLQESHSMIPYYSCKTSTTTWIYQTSNSSLLPQGFSRLKCQRVTNNSPPDNFPNNTRVVENCMISLFPHTAQDSLSCITLGGKSPWNSTLSILVFSFTQACFMEHTDIVAQHSVCTGPGKKNPKTNLTS